MTEDPEDDPHDEAMNLLGAFTLAFIGLVAVFFALAYAAGRAG